MRIVNYPHPTLRRTSKSLRRVDDDLRSMVRRMFELMYDAKGIGLAANQVDLPYRMFVINPSGDAARPEEEQVFINPVLSKPKGSEEAEEGCLSLPGLYAPVRRPETITLQAYSLSGEPVDATLSGLLARVVQHETDHLNGVLFVDRVSPTTQLDISPTLEEFETQFASQRQRGEIPSDAEILARLAALEAERT